MDADTASVREEPFDTLDAHLLDDDVVVVNDAAALPASIGFEHEGRRAELRVVPSIEPRTLRAVVLGAGDSTMATEDRGAPPTLVRGQRVVVDGGVALVVEEVDVSSPRLVTFRIDGPPSALLVGLYDRGEPIRYSYLEAPLELWDVQTPYAGRPWASEMPSAGRPLSWALLGKLRSRGIEVVRLTHGAGISSTGDPSLDARLPLPERYAIDADAADIIEGARREGRRIIAIGTSVTRALEAAARHGESGAIEAGVGVTDLIIGPSTDLLVVNVILTGMHEPGTSHFALLRAFADADLLERAAVEGSERGFLLHEFGDSMLLVGRGHSKLRAASRSFARTARRPARGTTSFQPAA